MSTKQVLNKVIRVYLLFITIISLVANLPVATKAFSLDSYYYKFTIDEDGFTQVDITFSSTKNAGSSWVFVPKYSQWRNTTLSGKIKTFSLVDTTDVIDQDYYFYKALKFDFVSTSNSFKLNIHFNMTGGALIIEPRGIFFSPQIGFDQDGIGESKAEVVLPSDYRIKPNLIVASSGRSTYSLLSSYRVIFNLQTNIERLQVEFETATAEPTWTQLNQSIFNFKTVKRYEKYASEILTLYNTVYNNFTELFNVTLGNINVQFFIPEFETLLSLGGFVPFTGQTLGEININIFFIRAINGTIQIIALHELVHHFLWKAGLSPDFFLWFHEGAAQFFSIETADDLGYPGASIERNKLEQGVSFLRVDDLGFLQEWTPENQLVDTAPYYVASYYVVSRLAEKYGELDFYKRFFELTHGLKYEPNGWYPNEWLAFYLSMAANASVDVTLKRWGFNIRLVYTESKLSPGLIYEAEKAIDGLNPVFQPYKLIAEFLYQQALLRLERGDIDGATQLLNLAISLANIAPLLTLLTLVAIFAIIAYILFKHTSEPSFEPQSLSPVYESTV